MVYLLDANVLIDANRDYYALSRVPQFWDWLVNLGQAGRVKIPQEIYEEVLAGDDNLASWLREDFVKDALLLEEEAEQSVVARVIEEGYASDLTDDEIDIIGRDPFLNILCIGA